jgi:8-oxo-dGTP pyrophosphatase MutT (NUDIX family)
VSEPFRTRGRAVPPADRRYRTRRAARVLVLAEGDGGPRVLMFHDQDPGTPGSGWWVLPGGGVDADETPRQAARRELAEESGHLVDESELYGPVAVRVVLHGYSDQVTAQTEEIFVLHVDEEFEVDISGHSESERQSVLGHAWRSVYESSDELIWPVDLAELVAVSDHPERWPVDLGTVEESVVPVALGHQGPAQAE